jgi:glycosyltransferase involved in cell wall biosynthesis
MAADRPAARDAAVRVLHCRAPQIFGGPERQILGLMEQGPPLGIEQQLLLISRHGTQADLVAQEASSRGLAVDTVESRARCDMAPLRKLRSMVRDGDFGIVCTHGYLPDILGFIATRRLPCRIMAVAHGYTAKSRSVKAYEWIAVRLVRRFDHVVVVSGALRERLVKSGVPAKRVTTIRNAVGRIEPLPRAEARERLGLPAEGFVVGSVGRLSPEKGHRFLLQASASLSREGVTHTVVLCGEGPHLEALRAQRSQLRLGDMVVFVGHREDVESVLSAFDVFALPSLTEGIPVALLEAGGAGLPAVASAVGGVPEVIVGDETGILVPPGDGEALASAIKRLHDDPGLGRRMGEAAQARILREFSREAQVLRYRDVLWRLSAHENGRI